MQHFGVRNLTYCCCISAHSLESVHEIFTKSASLSSKEIGLSFLVVLNKNAVSINTLYFTIERIRNYLKDIHSVSTFGTQW
jgi:hypothetical protein